MHHSTGDAMDKRLRFEAADLEVQAKMDEAGTLVIRIFKSDACVHQIAIDDAGSPLEHSWIADLFARQDRIALAALSHEADDYLMTLDVNQG